MGRSIQRHTRHLSLQPQPAITYEAQNAVCSGVCGPAATTARQPCHSRAPVVLYGLGLGRHGSAVGGLPRSARTYMMAIEVPPYSRPVTTPASTMERHG